MATKYMRLTEDLPTEEVQHERQQNGVESNYKPGICMLVINNDPDFSPNKKKDAEWQQLLFLALGFDVRVYPNQTAEEITKGLNSEEEVPFILSIISPGDTTSIQCINGETIQLSDLVSCISKASQDREVPKVVIFDLYQANGEARNYSGVTNIHVQHTLTMTSVTTSKNESQLTKILHEEIAHSDKDHSLSQIAKSVKQKLHDQHQQHVEINDTLHRQYYIKRGTSCMVFQEIAHKFREVTYRWIPMRDRTLQQLDDTIEKLIKHRRNVNIARITGSGISIGGATVAAIGFGLAPVTFGGSLGLSIGGIAVATAGGVTAAGASVADFAIHKANVKETQKMLNEDQEALKPVFELAGEMRQIVEQIEKQCPGINHSTITKFFTGIMAHSILRSGNIAVKGVELAFIGALELGALALRIGGTAAKAVAVAGIVLNVLLIPIDIVEIVRSGINIYQGNKSKAVVKLKELRKDIEMEMITIHKIAYPENYKDW